MAFSPDNPEDVTRLTGSIDWSLQRMKARRQERVEHIRRYVGKHYGGDGFVDNRPINMIELAVQIYLRGVASHAPRAQVSSTHQELQPYAVDLELALNQQINRMNLRDSFMACALEAMFCIGVMEVGITASNDPPDSEGYLYDPGQLFADPVLFEDLILDLNARHWDQQSYIGHDFVVPWEWVKDNKNFDPEVTELITAPHRDNEGGDTRYEEQSVNQEEFEETIRLRQVFLPRHKLILTLAPDFSASKPLQATDWQGPERGPYHPLSYGSVPGRLIPLAPVPMWLDLDDVVNRCFNKAADQALRQKKITLSNSAEDSDRIRDSVDGDHVFSPQAGDVQEVSYAGADQQTLAMVMWSKQMLDFLAGNLSSQAGLSSQTRTVGQDQLLAANASGRMKDMQQTTIEFQTDVITDLAFWLWNDPISEYHVIKPVSDGFSVPATFSPETREGTFLDYNFTVNPYSLQNMSPSEEGQQLVGMLTTLIVPALPMMMQQGIGVDWEFVLKTLAKKLNLDELSRMVVFSQGQMMPEREPVSKAGSTTRNYNRSNTPAGTQQGQEAAIMQMLLGGAESAQPSQMASLMQPVG